MSVTERQSPNTDGGPFPQSGRWSRKRRPARQRMCVVSFADRAFGADFAWDLVERSPRGAGVVLTLPLDERVTATALVYLAGITRSLLIGTANREGVTLEDLITRAKRAAINAAHIR